MQNPSKYSNWVITNNQTGSFVLQGSYPYTSDKRRKNNLDILLQLNIDVYVNLCQLHEIHEFGDYSVYANARYYWCPTPDMSITTDEALDDIVDKIVYELQVNNARVYVHCKGGHGRSSTILSCVLMRLHKNYDPEWAMSIIRTQHSTRSINSHFSVPHGISQISQVRRYATRHNYD